MRPHRLTHPGRALLATAALLVLAGPSAALAHSDCEAVALLCRQGCEGAPTTCFLSCFDACLPDGPQAEACLVGARRCHETCADGFCFAACYEGCASLIRGPGAPDHEPPDEEAAEAPPPDAAPPPGACEQSCLDDHRSTRAREACVLERCMSAEGGPVP